MITRREMLKRSGAAAAALAAIPGGWRALADGQAAEEDLTQYVNPFIGTGGHGHTYPGAQVPFGMVQLSPDNGENGWDWSSGYHWSSDHIAGFSHTHLSGTGIGDLCDVLLMPAYTASPPLGPLASGFSHDNERASPGYYSVRLQDSGITVELTASERVGFHRYSFPVPTLGRSPSIVVDLGYAVNWDRPTDTAITVEGPTLITGRRLSTGWAPNQHVYFAVTFSRPFVAHWLESEWSQPGAHRQLAGAAVRGVFQFLWRPDERLFAKVAISAVSAENALSNLNQEMPGWDFDGVRAGAARAWNRALGRVQVDGVTREGKAVLYTALYHALLAPQLFCDVDGSYRGPDGAVRQRRSFRNHSVFSLWDTFRAEHPLLTLVQPERVNDLVQSLIAFYREGGLLPVWPLVGNETNTMIGYHSAPVIVEALSKRLTTIDAGEALEAMKKSAAQTARGLQYYQVPEPRPLAELREEAARSELERIDQLKPNDFADTRLGIILNGYERSLAGSTINYPAPNPRARSALITRARADVAPIEWETGPVPEDIGGRISFAWLAAFDAGEARRRFELAVDGQTWFSFRGPRESEKSIRAGGPRGTTLTFRATHRDRHGDLLGYMFLTIPSRLSPGQRLRLKVTAEDAGSSEWYMTFEYPVLSRLIAANQYAYASESGGRRQVVRLDVELAGRPAEGVVSVDEVPTVVRLDFGANRIILTVPAVDQDTLIPVSVHSLGQKLGEAQLALRPVRPYDYIPAEWEGESVSKTLEYAYDDWCIARLAATLGEADDAFAFRQRARFYRNLFDPTTGFMRGRLSDGAWKEPFAPRAASQVQDEYTEGNAWQYTWFVPHDVQGLIELMGGREAFIAKLDELFEQTSEVEGAPLDVSGLIGQYAHGNEPSHHIAYLYAYAGAPWKTQERVRQITSTLYAASPDGLAGNEDCGQMSAWYIFSVLGFYPVNPAEGVYVIGTPHCERATLDVGGGRTFVVEAPGVSPTNKYIQSATLGGRPLERCYVTHEEIVAGGVLAFRMGAEPNRAWCAAQSAAPPSLTAP